MLTQPQVPCPVTHRFGPGIYIREVAIPAGTIAVGHHQNQAHQNVLLKGRLTILNENGSTSELKAPLTYVGKPGRKVGYIHEDMVWLNIYPNPTNETDVERLERQWITKSDGWQLAQPQRALLQSAANRNDYQQVLTDFGFTDAIARVQSENETDQCPMPFGSYKFKVANSPIEGRGLFATGDLTTDEEIGPATVGGKRTPIGRFTNHSANPNAEMVRIAGEFYLAALRPIAGCLGGQDGEEITCDYRVQLRALLGGKQ